MADQSLDTIQLRRLTERIRRGDIEAANDLVLGVCERLERLTRKMLRNDPRVHRWEQTGDVLQSSFLRLLNALKSVLPSSKREFYALATLQIRRELCDLARRHYGPQGCGANHASVGPGEDGGGLEAVDAGEDGSDYSEWIAFHEQTAQLPEKEREVFDLHYYQGKTQKETAAILDVDISTVERRWGSALRLLSRALRDRFPDLD